MYEDDLLLLMDFFLAVWNLDLLPPDWRPPNNCRTILDNARYAQLRRDMNVKAS